MDQFYLTLPSNSSMKYYPDNTVANYVTQLPRVVHLDGEWEVAVVEILYPCSFLTIDDSSYIYLNTYKESEYAALTVINAQPEEEKNPTIYIPSMVVCKLKPGTYSSVREVVKMINNDAALKDLVTFNYDRTTEKVEIKCKDHVLQIELTERLALQFGFDPNETDLKTNNTSIRPASLHLGLPQHIYAYCNVVEPQFIGDTMAPLLRIINVDTTGYLYGANKQVQFTAPHYVTVMKSNFESLEIDLRTSTGARVPFQFGTSSVKLHFRKKLTTR